MGSDYERKIFKRGHFLLYMKKATTGTIAILLATLFWGMTFVFIKEAVAGLNVFAFLFWRFGIASVLLMVVFARTLLKINRKLLVHGVILGLFLAGTVVFQSIGLQFTKASSASFITGLSVVLVTVFTALLQRKVPKWNVVLAVVLSTVGLGAITLSSGLMLNKGDVWVLLCAACFAWYIIFAGRYTRQHGSLPLTIVQIVTIAVISGVLALASSSLAVPQTYKVWQAILFCSLFASVIAFTLQIHYQKYVSPAKTAIIFTLEPVFATLTAVLYASEALTARFLLGASLIFVAMLIAEIKGKFQAIPQE